MLKIVKKLPKRYESAQPIEDILPAVRRIISDVRAHGDRAVAKYAKRFDKIAPKRFELSKQEIKTLTGRAERKVKKLLKNIAARVKEFAAKQINQFGDFTHSKDGVKLTQKVVPVERAGIYVPGGRYPLASTAIMGIVPAKVAGVREIAVCTPNPHPVTITAALAAGADRIFRIGGAQAIAAMAIGTRSVPRVDIIAGPGNIYVAAAKKELYGETGIDFIAGPTELALVADSSAPIDFAAADVLAQAEHDPQAIIIVITDSEKWAKDLKQELSVQLKDLPTAETAKESLKKNRILLVANIKEASAIVNGIAPEHCQVMTRRPLDIAKRITNCGTILIGPFSSCALSDYSTGGNHILPTALAGRYTAGLSVHNFLKFITVQEVTRKGAGIIVPLASELANLEGLEAHRRAADIRLKRKSDDK